MPQTAFLYHCRNSFLISLPKQLSYITAETDFIIILATTLIITAQRHSYITAANSLSQSLPQQFSKITAETILLYYCRNSILKLLPQRHSKITAATAF